MLCPKEILRHRLLIPALIIAGLLFALYAQYIQHIAPCPLCLYQRYVFAGLLGAFVFTPLSFLRLPLLLLGLALSIYQLGIEQHFWTDFFHTCTVSSADSLRMQLMKDIAPSCDQVGWKIFGISAVIWTMLFNLTLLLLFGYQYVKKTPPSH